MLVVVWACLIRVGARRLSGKRRHPKWSYFFEVGVELCRSALDFRELRGRPGGQRAGTPVTPPSLKIALKVKLTHGTLAGLPTEIHTPKGALEGRTFLYVHGGGYVGCSPRTHRALIAEIALRSAARTFAIDYRKAPEYPFPAAVDDCVRAYQALLADGVEPTRLVVGGDSAGGGLVLALMQRLRNADVALPAATVLLSPLVDLTERGGSMVSNAPFDYLDLGFADVIVDHYVGGHDPLDPLVSPLFADLSNQPPMLVLTGSHEMLRDQNIEFVERARKQGVDVTHEIGDNMVHVYPLLAEVSRKARAAIATIGQFVQRRTLP
jgi:acetyl esterase/lipase